MYSNIYMQLNSKQTGVLPNPKKGKTTNLKRFSLCIQTRNPWYKIFSGSTENTKRLGLDAKLLRFRVFFFRCAESENILRKWFWDRSFSV